jgi:hypothetical protein
MSVIDSIEKAAAFLVRFGRSVEQHGLALPVEWYVL